MDLISTAQSYFRGKVLVACVRLGVADALGAGEHTLADLAVATSCDAGGLRRLLRALVAMEVVAEPSPGRFALTPTGNALRRDAPNSVWASIVFWADLLADSWTYLPECVRAGGREGGTAAMEREGVTSRWSRVSDAHAIFNAVFGGSGGDDRARIAAACDLSHAHVVADLGGAGGGLLAAFLGRNPHLRGILVDRDDAVTGARRSLGALGLSARVECIAADLLESVPAGADVYVMSRVLHGYRDDAARVILGNCRRAMAPGARLVVVETVLPDRITAGDEDGERMVMSDLNMLAVTGGLERTADEWVALLASAGFAAPAITTVPGVSGRLVETAPVAS